MVTLGSLVQCCIDYAPTIFLEKQVSQASKQEMKRSELKTSSNTARTFPFDTGPSSGLQEHALYHILAV